jgi:hypothetical protein
MATPNIALESAKRERAYSQRKLDEAQPRLELLRKLRREDHVGPLLDSLVQRRSREQGR